MSVVAVFLVLLGVGSAQEVQRRIQAATALSNTEKVFSALVEMPPFPAKATPKAGMFYTFQNGEAWPPLPGNVLGLPFWKLGEGFYILDDREVDYVRIRKATEEIGEQVPMMARSMLNSEAAYGNPVYLTNITATLVGTQSVTASFNIAGGTNNVPYDILKTTNVADSVSLWNWLGIGYTGNSYTFSNQSPDLAFYVLAKPQKTMVVAWGTTTRTSVPCPLESPMPSW